MRALLWLRWLFVDQAFCCQTTWPCLPRVSDVVQTGFGRCVRYLLCILYDTDKLLQNMWYVSLSIGVAILYSRHFFFFSLGGKT